MTFYSLLCNKWFDFCNFASQSQQERIMIGKFFHLPKNKQFNVPYRYYNPDKEEMADRKVRMKSELGMSDKNEVSENYRPNIKGQFRRTTGNVSKSVSEAKRRSNIRLMIIIAVLCLIVYLIIEF